MKVKLKLANALHLLLVNTRSNVQFGIKMQFDDLCPVVRSLTATDLFTESWNAMKPLLDFVSLIETQNTATSIR